VRSAILNQDIVIVGGTEWSAENQIPQQMVRAAIRATSGKVLYVYRELQTNPFRALAKRQWMSVGQFKWKSVHTEVEDRLHLVSLGGLNALFPLTVWPRLGRFRRSLFRRQILRAMKQVEVEPTSATALVYWWHFPTLWRQLKFRSVIFDVIDDQAALGMNLGRSRHNNLTRNLVSETSLRADAVTILSPGLVDILPRASFPKLMPSPIDVSLADANLNFGFDSTKRQKPTSTTTVAFVGGTVGRVDWDLVEGVALARAHWKFLFIGSRVPAELPANIIATDPLPYGEVLRLLQECQVGWVPFLENSLTRSADFMKTWDYRLAGLRVVATELPCTVGAAEVDHGVWTVQRNIEVWLTTLDMLVFRQMTEGALPISTDAIASRSSEGRLRRMLALVV
jgi:hypothetical protein